MQQLQPLRPYFQSQRGRACEVTAGPAEARDQPEVDRVTRYKEDYWSCLGRGLRRKNRRGRWRDNYSHLAMNKISRQCRQFVVPAFGPEIFDRHILALDKSGRLQPQAECAQPVYVQVGRVAAHKPNSWQLPRLLRTRRERPSGYAAEQRDELTTLHSITSSARASTVGGVAASRLEAVHRLGPYLHLSPQSSRTKVSSFWFGFRSNAARHKERLMWSGRRRRKNVKLRFGRCILRIRMRNFSFHLCLQQP